MHLRLGVIRPRRYRDREREWGICPAIAIKFKTAPPLPNAIVVTIVNGFAGSRYVHNDAAFGAYTLQVLGSRLEPGCAEDAITDGWVDLVRDGTR